MLRDMQNTVRGFALALGCFMLLALQVKGQHKIDSLLQELKTSSKKKTFDVHLGLCYEYSDEAQVLHHAKLAFSIAKELKDSLGIIKAGRIVGRGYKIFNELDSAVEVLRYILPIAKGSRFAFEYGQLLNTLSVTYIYKANYAEALRCSFEALSVMERLDNRQWISIVLINIGLVYYKIEDPAKALEYFSRSYRLKQTIHYDADLNMLLIDMGLCYNDLGRYEEAESHVKAALDVCKSDCSDYIKLQIEFTFGTIAFTQEKMVTAEAHFLRSYSLAKEINDKRLQFDNVVYLSQIYQRNNQFQKAEKYLIEAEKLVNKTGYDLEVVKLYEQFFRLYEKVGSQQKMVLYQKKYIQLKDSVYNEKYTNNLMRVQAEYLEHENKTRLAAQQQMLDLKDKIIVRQNLLNVLTGIAAILLILIVCILYRNNKQRKIANQLLDQKVKERTRELESSYNQLRNRLEEEDLTVKKAMTDVRSAVATMKGLRSLAVRENVNSESVKQMELLDLTLGRLVEALKGVSEPVVNSSDEPGN